MVDEQQRQRAVRIAQRREDALDVDLELDRRDSISSGEPVAVETFNQDGTAAPTQQRGEALIRHALKVGPDAGARRVIMPQGHPEPKECFLLEVLAIRRCRAASGHRRRAAHLNGAHGLFDG